MFAEYMTLSVGIVIIHSFLAGHHSSVGSDVAWESRGTAIDPRVQHIFS